jgi:GT2 family glycosyltransferase
VSSQLDFAAAELPGAGRPEVARRDLAIIIVSYNCAAWLGPCLTSVYEHAGDVDLDVVVVDNNSTDGSPELVERQFPQARVLRCENRGFAAGNNAGLKSVQAPFVLFLNPDTEVLAGTFGELLDEMDARPDVGLLGCRHLTPTGETQPTIRRFPAPIRSFCEALGSERWPLDASWLGERVLNAGPYDRETYCDWPAGSFMLGRRDAVLDAGLMDERYFLYCEEPDLCLRLKRRGWRACYVPTMTILHHIGKAGWNERLVAQRAYSRRLYIKKNMSPLRGRLALLALIFGYMLRTVYVGGEPAVAAAHKACARAAVRTLLGRMPPPFAAPA